MNFQKLTVNLPLLCPGGLNEPLKNRGINNVYHATPQQLCNLATKCMEVIHKSSDSDYLLEQLTEYVNSNPEDVLSFMLFKVKSVADQLKVILKQWTAISSGKVHFIDRQFAYKYEIDDNMFVTRHPDPQNRLRESLSEKELMENNDNDIYYAYYIITETYKYLAMEPTHIMDVSLCLFVISLIISNAVKEFTPVSVVTEKYSEYIVMYMLDMIIRSRYVDFWFTYNDKYRYLSQINTMAQHQQINCGEILYNLLDISDAKERAHKFIGAINSLHLHEYINMYFSAIADAPKNEEGVFNVEAVFTKLMTVCKNTSLGDDLMRGVSNFAAESGDAETQAMVETLIQKS